MGGGRRREKNPSIRKGEARGCDLREEPHGNDEGKSLEECRIHVSDCDLISWYGSSEVSCCLFRLQVVLHLKLSQ
ncbi:unnamed protein product [Urochloa humidicola]